MSEPGSDRGLRGSLPPLDGESEAGQESAAAPTPPRLVALGDPLAGSVLGGSTGSGRSRNLERSTRRGCPFGVCDGSGWVAADDEDFAEPCRCRQQRIDRARATGVSATLPRRYQGVSFERPPVSEMARDPQARAVVADIRSYCDGIDEVLDAGEGLWLEGETGTGKTTLAMLVSRHAIDAGRSVAIYSLPRLLARIRRTFDAEGNEDSYFTFFNRLTSVDLLQLDDLGAENRTEWVLEQLYSIIDRRYEEQRSVVVTTNLSEDLLREQLGDRITSRLTEICGDPKVLTGGDRRVELSPEILGGGTLPPGQSA